MSNINILKASIEPIANMLAGKQIKVTFHRDVKVPVTDFSGETPTIKLPMLSDQTPPEVLDAIHGVVDHEVAHAIWSTNPTKLPIKDKLGHSITNLVEDVRIEREMRNLFKGSAYNLQNLARSIVNEEFLGNLINLQYAKPQMFRMVAANLCLQATEGVGYYQEVVEKIDGLKQIYNLLTETYGPRPMNAVRSTADAVEFGEKLRGLLKIELEEEEQQKDDSESEESSSEEDSEGEGASGSDSSKPSKGKSKGKSKKDKSESKGEESKGEGDSKDEGGSGDEKEEDKGEGDSKEEPKKSKSKSKGKGEPKPEAAEGSKDGDDKDKGKKSKADKPAIGSEDFAGDPLKPEDLDELSDMTQKVIKALVEKAQANDTYTVATTDFDKVAHIAPSKRVEKVADLNEQVKAMTGVIQKNLERAIAARSIVMWTPGHRSGKLFAPALYKLTTGDERVFRRREEAMSKDVAVSLVVDCSGSMTGDNKAPTAATASYALCEVLTRMGIKNEVIGFTTTSYERILRSKTEEYSREEAIYMPIFKAFNDKFDMTARLRMVKMFESHWMADNVDGESLNYAAQRLMAQNTKRKIMIVLSDGYPAAYGDCRALCKHLKATVEDLSKKISIVGIGIKSDAVEDYYPKYVVLNKVEDLPTTVVRELQKFLTPK